jgi:hypothetical protein
MTDINMVPLIDVMLVLLVIFIVTAPLLTHAVKLDLPKASAPVNQLKPDKIEFAIDAQGQRFYNGARGHPRPGGRPLSRQPARCSRCRNCTCAPTRPWPTARWPKPWPTPRARG